MKAIVTVIGKDQVGIIASICSLLSQHEVNILDISQTVLQEYFTMVMLADLSQCQSSIGELGAKLEQAGQERNLSIRIQREDIFNAMHRIDHGLILISDGRGESICEDFFAPQGGQRRRAFALQGGQRSSTGKRPQRHRHFH